MAKQKKLKPIEITEEFLSKIMTIGLLEREIQVYHEINGLFLKHYVEGKKPADEVLIIVRDEIYKNQDAISKCLNKLMGEENVKEEVKHESVN